LAFVACKKREEPQPRSTGSGSAATAQPAKAGAHDAIDRMTFNRTAVHLNIPVYWIADANNNKSIEPDEVAPLLFYPTQGTWTKDGKLTPEFEDTYGKIVAASKAAPPTDKRLVAVLAELDGGRPSPVRSDFSSASPDDRAFV